MAADVDRLVSEETRTNSRLAQVRAEHLLGFVQRICPNDRRNFSCRIGLPTGYAAGRSCDAPFAGGAGVGRQERPRQVPRRTRRQWRRRLLWWWRLLWRQLRWRQPSRWTWQQALLRRRQVSVPAAPGFSPHRGVRLRFLLDFCPDTLFPSQEARGGEGAGPGRREGRPAQEVPQGEEVRRRCEGRLASSPTVNQFLALNLLDYGRPWIRHWWVSPVGLGVHKFGPVVGALHVTTGAGTISSPWPPWPGFLVDCLHILGSEIVLMTWQVHRAGGGTHACSGLAGTSVTPEASHLCSFPGKGHPPPPPHPRSDAPATTLPGVGCGDGSDLGDSHGAFQLGSLHMLRTTL